MKKNFREVNTCFNCKFAYFLKNQEWPECYCNYDGDAESELGADIIKMTDEEFDKVVEWEGLHVAYLNTICDEWESNQ